MELKLSDFEVVQNLARPVLCQKWLKLEGDRKYEIFTMDNKYIWYVTIEEKREDGRYYLIHADKVTEFRSAMWSINNFLGHENAG